MKLASVSIPVLAAMAFNHAAAQQYVYPAKGQSPQQQKSDEAASNSWAIQQTGFDPAKPPTIATCATAAVRSIYPQ